MQPCCTQYPADKHPSKVPIFNCFGVRKTFWAEIRKFLPGYACEQRFTSFVSKMVEIDAGYVTERLLCISDRKKTRFGTLGRTPSLISSIFMWVRTVAPHFYSRFYPDPSRFGELKPKNPSATHQSKCNIGTVLRAYNECRIILYTGVSSSMNLWML